MRNVDQKLRRLPIQQLRELIERQMESRRKCVDDIAEYDRIVTEEVGEFMRRCKAGEATN